MEPAVVIDSGSGTLKCGFSNETRPRSVFPSVIGRPRIPFPGAESESCVLYGKDALRKRGLVSLRYPVEHGIVVDWDDAESLWHQALFNELRVNPHEHSLLMTEAMLNPRSNAEKTAEIMLEQLHIQSLAFCTQPKVALLSTGRTSGLVVDCGDGVTHAVPLFEGTPVPQGIMRLDLGGRDVTDYFIKLLSRHGYEFSTCCEREIAREIKEKTCRVAKDLESEMREIQSDSSKQTIFELPDGNEINLMTAIVEAPEIMLNPKLVDVDEPGIHHLICTSISKTELDLRTMFLRNIVLTGGNSMFGGMQKRLKSEINANTPRKVRCKISKTEHPAYNVWIGAAVLADMHTFRSRWITASEFRESGLSLLHRNGFHL